MPGFAAPFCAGGMLMGSDNRGVDHEPFGVRAGRQSVENHLPNALLRPAPKASERGVPVAILPRQGPPASPVAPQPHDGLNETPVILSGSARIALLARQSVLNALPLIFSQMLGITQPSLLVGQNLISFSLNVHTT